MIDVQHVTMKFRLTDDRMLSLKEYMVALLKKKLHYRTFTVLRILRFLSGPERSLGLWERTAPEKVLC